MSLVLPASTYPPPADSTSLRLLLTVSLDLQIEGKYYVVATQKLQPVSYHVMALHVVQFRCS